MILPSIVRVRVAPPFRFLPTLILPVFLLWPLLFVLLAPLLLLGLVFMAIVDARSLPRVLSLFGGVYRVQCETRGVRVDVRGPRSQVFISIM